MGVPSPCTFGFRLQTSHWKSPTAWNLKTCAHAVRTREIWGFQAFGPSGLDLRLQKEMFQRLGINEALSPTAWNRTGLYWSSNFTRDAAHDKVPKAWNLKNIPSLWTGGLEFLLWQTIKSKSFTLKFQNGSNGLEFSFKIPKGVRAPGTYSSKPLE
jgi:hypothetical protein